MLSDMLQEFIECHETWKICKGVHKWLTSVNDRDEVFDDHPIEASGVSVTKHEERENQDPGSEEKI